MSESERFNPHLEEEEERLNCNPGDQEGQWTNVEDQEANLIPAASNCPLLSKNFLFEENFCTATEVVSTPHGPMEVSRSGAVISKSSPVIITFHDIGLNQFSNYSSFFGIDELSEIKSKFSVLHLVAPGQKSSAEDLPADFQYPSIDTLSQMVEYVCHYYGVSSFVGLGVGLGANVLVRLAHRRPKFVNGLVLLNCNVSAPSWTEWAHFKLNMKSFKKSLKFPESIAEYLLWYHLGDNRSPTLSAMYKQHFLTQVNSNNLALLMEAYATRTEIKLARDIASNGKPLYGGSRTLKMPVLNIVGNSSPHIDATVAFNGKLDPTRCTWMKIQDAGMVLEEQPAKVAEAMGYFLQGLGYTLRSRRAKRICSTPLPPIQDSSQARVDV